MSSSDPGNSRVIIVEIEMPDLGFDEVINNGWKDFGNFCIRHQRDLVDCVMVISDKSKMLDDITETFPSRESPGFNDQPVKLTLAFNNRVDLTCDCREILLRQGALRVDQAVVVVWRNSNHLDLVSGISLILPRLFFCHDQPARLQGLDRQGYLFLDEVAWHRWLDAL